jgi:colanic acid/amylovoran biosynthesis glycosyltransferase
MTMHSTYKRIAYLAPELPSLSATFVTNEVWALEDKGLEIEAFSVHRPGHKAHGERAAELASRTTILYEQSLLCSTGALLANLFTHPLATLKAKARLISDIVKVGPFSKNALKLAYQFLRGAWLARELRRREVEHLHIHFAHVPTQIGMYAGSLASVPFTFMAHANDIFERPLLIREKVQRAKRGVSISQFNIELMDRQGADRENIEIVRCSVDSTIEMRSEPIIAADKPLVIGTLGRLVEKKGIDTLVQAGKLLKERGVSFHLEIAGDGPERELLEGLVQDYDLQNQVSFLGSMPHSDVMKWMRNLDSFVLAGKKDRNGDMDGIPVVLMEAMNTGIPVLSTRLSGIPELVIHKQTGLLSDPENAHQLADNLARLSEDHSLKNQLTTGAKNWIRDEFDQSLNANRLIKIFHLND